MTDTKLTVEHRELFKKLLPIKVLGDKAPDELAPPEDLRELIVDTFRDAYFVTGAMDDGHAALKRLVHPFSPGAVFELFKLLEKGTLRDAYDLHLVSAYAARLNGRATAEQLRALQHVLSEIVGRPKRRGKPDGVSFGAVIKRRVKVLEALIAFDMQQLDDDDRRHTILYKGGEIDVSTLAIKGAQAMCWDGTSEQAFGDRWVRRVAVAMPRVSYRVMQRAERSYGRKAALRRASEVVSRPQLEAVMKGLVPLEETDLEDVRAALTLIVNRPSGWLDELREDLPAIEHVLPALQLILPPRGIDVAIGDAELCQTPPTPDELDVVYSTTEGKQGKNGEKLSKAASKPDAAPVAAKPRELPVLTSIQIKAILGLLVANDTTAAVLAKYRAVTGDEGTLEELQRQVALWAESNDAFKPMLGKHFAPNPDPIPDPLPTMTEFGRKLVVATLKKGKDAGLAKYRASVSRPGATWEELLAQLNAWVQHDNTITELLAKLTS